MIWRYLRVFTLATVTLFAAVPLPSAQQGPQPGVLAMLPGDAVTAHETSIGEEAVAYSAKAGTLPLFDQTGKPLASIFYTAYTRTGFESAERPITFVFNGGPGAAAVYLHLGLVGPLVADFGARPDGATARLIDNPVSWIAFTDLVLIDPIGAGWSRTARPGNASDFWSVDADADTLAKVIALYLSHNGRHQSPKYLLGESYGGFRAAKVARALQNEQGTIVSGIVMVSPFLDGGFQYGTHALGEALTLPSIAASELDRRGTYSPEALADAERFAITDYLVTLAGPPLQGAAARVFHERVATMSGLPVDLVARTRGFIARSYLDHARDSEGGSMSPYDGAFVAADPYPESGSDRGDDPILEGYLAALGNLFVGYARDHLTYRTDVTYRVLNRETSRRWNWGRGGRLRASVSQDLRELLALNPSFRLLVGHGRSDLVTPYAISAYLLNRLPGAAEDGRAQLGVYRGGHMFYFDAGARAEFTRDAQAFYGKAMR
jgi:carboxypeptidase C (cathepsin A)